MAGFVMPACSTARLKRAERSGHTCDGDARHRSVDRSNACAAQTEPRPGMPGARYFRSRASGSATPLRPSAWSFSHHARARDSCSRRLGAKLSGNIKARSRALALPHDDRAVIEIQILDPQLQTLTDPHARSIQKLGEQTMLAFQKTEDANHFIRGQHHRQAPRRPRSSDLLKPGQIRAQHLA